jgi:hypothetical protein
MLTERRIERTESDFDMEERVVINNPGNIFMITKSKKAKIWLNTEDDNLVKAARKFGYRNWNAIARQVPGRTSVQCTARFKRLKPGIIKGSWSTEEDELLRNLVATYGRNWSTVARYMPSRNGKQIRDRYLNALDPLVVKDKFSEEEDQNILKYYRVYGSAWSKISKLFSGRTADIIKNRFYSTLRKRVHRREYDETLKRRKINRDRNKLIGKFDDKIRDGRHILGGEGTRRENFRSSPQIDDSKNSEAIPPTHRLSQPTFLVKDLKLKNFHGQDEEKSQFGNISRTETKMTFNITDAGGDSFLSSQNNLNHPMLEENFSLKTSRNYLENLLQPFALKKEETVTPSHVDPLCDLTLKVLKNFLFIKI